MQQNQPPPEGLQIGDHNLRALPARQAANVQPFQPIFPGIGVAAPVLNNDPPHEAQLLPDQVLEPEQVPPNNEANIIEAADGDLLQVDGDPLPQNLHLPPNPPANMADAQQIEAKYPPTFYARAGEDVKDFIQKFRIYAQIKGIYDNLDQVKCHLGQFLGHGPCTRWWSAHQAEDAAIPDTATYLQSFQTHFDRPAPTFNILEELRERKFLPTDTIETYADGVQKLCNKINMSEMETINSFILGLPASVRGTVAALNPQTFSQAYTHACKLKGSLPTSQSTAAVAALQTMASNVPTAVDPKLAAVSTQLDGIIGRLNKIEVGQSNNTGTNCVCQLCGRSGHTAPSCFTLSNPPRVYQGARNMGQAQLQPNTGRPRNKANIECHYCHRNGHFIRDCRKKKAADAFSSNNRTQGFGLPTANAMYHQPQPFPYDFYQQYQGN